jgi:hypothetical protein
MREIKEFEVNKHLSEIFKAVDGGKGLTIKKEASLSSTYRQPLPAKNRIKHGRAAANELAKIKKTVKNGLER